MTLPSCVTDIKGGGDDEVWSCPVEKEPYPGVKGVKASKRLKGQSRRGVLS